MALSLKESIARQRAIVRDDEIIEGRSAYLAPEDRDLIRAVWLKQHSTRLVASLTGCSPRIIRHRVRKLIRRMHSEEFLGAVRLMQMLDEQRSAVARLHFCQGLSTRATAREAKLPYTQVRRMVAEIRGMIRLGSRYHRRSASERGANARRTPVLPR